MKGMVEMQKFREGLQRLSVQVSERQEYIGNEEMAKQSLIVPFLATLGYEVFNPLEVHPEYDSEFGKKKGEKVDYAVIKNGIPIMFVEAKSPAQKLENHDSQLARYFNATPEVKIAVITNGICYKFFTDLGAANIMDDSPFLEIVITELKDSDIEALSRIRKEVFDSQQVVSFAEELIYTSNLNVKLEEIFKNPPDEFIRYLIKDFSDTKVTQNVINRFRPIVKKSISQALLHMVSQGLASQTNIIEEEPLVEIAASLEPNSAKEENSTKRKVEIVTTEEELAAFELIKTLIENAGKVSSYVQYKDTTTYFSIYVKNPSNWLVRLYLDGAKKNITTNLPIDMAQKLAPSFEVSEAIKGMGISRVFINGINDIPVLKDLLVACFDDIVRVKD